MTVFNTFWKIIRKYRWLVILYTVLLVSFGGINISSNNNNTTFSNSKPSVVIVNNDLEVGLTKNLIDYIKDNSEVITLKNNEDALDDSLFYREVSYVIYIKDGYRNQVLNGEVPEIEIKTTGNYDASLADIMLKRYLKVQNVYRKYISYEDQLIESINDSLSENVNVEVTSKLDQTKEEKVSRYFNYASYSIMAVILFIVCLTLSSFNKKELKLRTIVSSMDYKKHNRLILLASLCYVVLVWLVYVILGAIILKVNFLNLKGLFYLLNSFIFSFCSLSLALLISTLVNNKNAVGGVVNVVALGQAFLCGAFIPTEFLPQSVINIAHILPSYWFINTNDLLQKIEVMNTKSIQQIVINILVLIGFSILFIIVNNIVTRFKNKS